LLSVCDTLVRDEVTNIPEFIVNVVTRQQEKLNTLIERRICLDAPNLELFPQCVPVEAVKVSLWVSQVLLVQALRFFDRGRE